MSERLDPNNCNGACHVVLGLRAALTASQAEVERLTRERDEWQAQVVTAEFKARVRTDGYGEALSIATRAMDVTKVAIDQRDATLARATAAEQETAQVKSWANETLRVADEACTKWMVRAKAAEVCEERLRKALHKAAECCNTLMRRDGPSDCCTCCVASLDPLLRPFLSDSPPAQPSEEKTRTICPGAEGFPHDCAGCHVMGADGCNGGRGEIIRPSEEKIVNGPALDATVEVIQKYITGGPNALNPIARTIIRTVLAALRGER